MEVLDSRIVTREDSGEAEDVCIITRHRVADARGFADVFDVCKIQLI